MRHPDGEIALFNDSAVGIAPEPAALLDYGRRLGLDAPAYASRSFPETGYHVWRAGSDALIVDAGPIGPDYVPAHAHGDIFSFELSLEGRRVVVDGGTSSYETGAERDWARSTRAHNTVEIAGSDQAEFFGAFRVGRRGRPRDVAARVSAEGLQLSGWHDGYRRLAGRPIHRRELQLAAEAALLVWDTVESPVAQTAVSRVRFAPGARVRLEGKDSAAIEAAGVTLALHSFGARLALEEGYYAQRFGERVPCPVLALYKDAGPEFGYALARASARPGSTRPARRSRVGRWSAGADALRAPGRPREDRRPQPLLLAGAGAPSARLLEMSREWAARGHEVTVVTNFPNHPTGVVPPAYRGRSFLIEHTQGLRVIRCRTYATPNRGFLKRTLGHLVFMFEAVWQATRHLRGTDVLVASSPTLFCVVAALAISRRLKVPYVFEVRDLWPAIFVELGVIRNRLVIAALERLELALYRRAGAVVAVTHAFADDIAQRRHRPRQAPVIPERRRPRVVPTGSGRAALRARLGLADKLVCCTAALTASATRWAGSWRWPQAAERSGNPLPVRRRGSREGRPRRPRPRAGARQRDVPRERCRARRWPRTTGPPTSAWCPLRAVPLFRAFIPSKMFEILACGRPVVASLEGEAARILEASGAALVVPPEDVDAIAAAVTRLAADPGCARRWPPAGGRTSRSASTASVSRPAISSCSRPRFGPRRAQPYNPSLSRRPLVSERGAVKVLHVVGARPNFMKVAPVMRGMAAREGRFEQRLVHTGQHYDEAMSQVFFDELGIAPPDENLEVGSESPRAQTAEIMLRFEPVIEAFRPDWLVVVGDVNSTMAATLVARRSA
jgi:glycosyltransferase involved in cell wall biosynthesis